MMRYKPMLAYPVSSKPIDYSKLVFMQPKLDGVRCVIQNEKREGYEIVTAYSRTGKEWKNINHILGQLRPFFDKFPNVVLDGELYNHDLKDNFEKIISLVRKTKPTNEDRLEASKLTQFHCYDIIDETLLFDQRMDFLNNAFSNMCPGIYIVETHEVLSEGFAKNIHKVFLKMGYEGSIVRTNDTYHCNRSHNLRKFKDFHDAEATIVGFVEGKGKRIGTVGKFVAIDADGVEFGMPVMDNFKYLQKNFRKMQGWIDKTATFTYFERTKKGSYRHPLFKCIRDYE